MALMPLRPRAHASPASASADFTPMNVARRSYFQDALRAAKLG